jgi:hypothetical protein
MKFLIACDLSDFRPWHDQRAFAIDAASKNQKVLSLSPALQWLKEVIDTVDGEGPAVEYDWVAGLPHPAGQPYGQSRQSKWPPRFPRREALAAFREWATKAKPFGAAEYTGSPEKFWAEICKIIPRAQTNHQITGGVRTISIALADVEENLEKYLEGRSV